MTMDYSPWVEREIWPLLKGSYISETGEAMPTKNGMHGLADLVYSTPLPPPTP